MRRSLVLFLTLLSLIVANCLVGCGPKTQAQDDSSGSGAEADSVATSDSDSDTTDAPVPVEAVVIERGPMEAVLSSSATIEAESQIFVIAEAARRVQELFVEEGDQVKRGALLLRLQDAEQRSALRKAENLLDTARREFERQERLQEQELTSEKTLNEAQATYEQRQLEFEDAQRELGYTEVRAPISGTVVQRSVNLGDQVNVGSQLFQIIDFSSLISYIYVPEKDLARLQVGQTARVRASALQNRSFECKVKRISPIVDARSGTIKVTIDIGRQDVLRPGLYVDVDVVTDVRAAAVRVPKRAIVYGEDQLFVFRIADGGVARRTLLVPELEDRQYVVPAMGIEEGDSLVTAGQAGLKDGAKVRVVDRDAEATVEAAQS